MFFKRNNSCDYCDFASEHKLLYFLLPISSPARSTVYSIFDIQQIKGYKSKKRMYNTFDDISKKYERFRVLFNDKNDWIKEIEKLRLE